MLIPLSVVLVAVIVVAFFWAIRSGQFDDLEGPAHRILLDDDDKPHAVRGSVDDRSDDRGDDEDDRSEHDDLALVFHCTVICSKVSKRRAKVSRLSRQ